MAVRSNEEHMKTVQEHEIGLIDMVVVNLYEFEKVAAKKDAPLEELIENIDIGGPTMIRAAANRDAAKLVSDAEAELAAGTGSDATVSYWLECGSSTTRLAYTSSCSPGQAYARFVGISISSSFTPLFGTRFFPGANADGTFTDTDATGAVDRAIRLVAALQMDARYAARVDAVIEATRAHPRLWSGRENADTAELRSGSVGGGDGADRAGGAIR